MRYTSGLKKILPAVFLLSCFSGLYAESTFSPEWFEDPRPWFDNRFLNEWFLAYDISFNYEYQHNIGGIVTLFNKDYDNSREFRLPLEARRIFFECNMYGSFKGTVYKNQFTLSATAIGSFYYRKKEVPALHISSGISCYTHVDLVALDYFFMSFYPLFEYPLFDLRTEAYQNWRIACDIGVGFYMRNRRFFCNLYWRGIIHCLDSEDFFVICIGGV